jgi:hypothetical protein
MSPADVDRHMRRVHPHAGIIMVVVVGIPQVVPVPVVAVIVRMPAGVIPVVVMPVVRSPRIPVNRIIAPVP